MSEPINVMARNFVASDTLESKYSKAREAGMQARGQMANRQNSILLAGMAACAAEDSLSRRVLEGKKAARRMGLDMRQNISERHEDTLEALKKAMEERAKEGSASGDAQATGSRTGKAPARNAAETAGAAGDTAEGSMPGAVMAADAAPQTPVSQRVVPGDVNVVI